MADLHLDVVDKVQTRKSTLFDCACCGLPRAVNWVTGGFYSYCSECRFGFCPKCKVPPIESRVPAALQPRPKQPCPTCGRV